MDKPKCKYCQAEKFYLKECGPHIGLYCEICGKWQKWIPQCELIKYQNMGIRGELQLGGKNNFIIGGNNGIY